MRKIILGFTACYILTLGFVIYFYSTVNQKPLIGYVDATTLIKNYNAAIDFKKDYEQKSQLNKMRLDTLVQELKQSGGLLEKNKKYWPQEKLKAEKKQIELKSEQISNYRDYLFESARKEDERVTNQIMKEISNCVKQYGAENKYTVILVNTGYGATGYASEGIDITKKIITVMNNNYQRSKK